MKVFSPDVVTLTAGAALASAFSWASIHLLGGWTPTLSALVLLAAVDYATGVWASAREGRRGEGPGLSSRRGIQGVARKVWLFVLLAVAHHVDVALNQSPTLRNMAAFWLLANELLSITENAGRVGLPIPPALVAAVAVLKGRGGEKAPAPAPVAPAEAPAGGDA